MVPTAARASVLMSYEARQARRSTLTADERRVGPQKLTLWPMHSRASHPCCPCSGGMTSRVVLPVQVEDLLEADKARQHPALARLLHLWDDSAPSMQVNQDTEWYTKGLEMPHPCHSYPAA